MKIYIASCEFIRSGNKNGRVWNMYRVLDDQGKNYTTFNEKYAAMIGQEIDVDIQEQTVTKGDKTYTNRTIVEPRKGKMVGNDDAIKLLVEIKQIVTRIENNQKPLGFVGSPQVGLTPPVSNDAGEELPF